MNKFSALVVGLALGAILMFVALKYHVVRASDGFHMVPKASATLGNTYADVREYTVNDWRENQDLMLAITNSEDVALQEEAAKSALGNTFDQAWDAFTGADQ